MSQDQETADAFANSWNHLPAGSIYTRGQFEDWMAPLSMEDFRGKRVLELGCGNGSLMIHAISWEPEFLLGLDLGDSVLTARNNLSRATTSNWRIEKTDLTEFESDGFDIVYSIGVLHHLKDPKRGLDAVIRNTKSGGRFHVWVYAREGNGLIVHIVDPIRRIASRLPWWCTKYMVAIPLVVPYYFYAKWIQSFRHLAFAKKLPLYEYSLWIAKREFAFFRHVAFDQLVTPETKYITKDTIATWLQSYSDIASESAYLVMRNGNSWKFGGQKQ